ncbi:MAG: membrane associated rhomboid family serine protease [Cognaticolwellia sp.]|jgi:membrane associated rhomboid family serine protease
MAELKYDGATVPVDLNDLDERVRAGSLPATAQLRHAPWTGESWRSLGELPELQDAFRAPGARMSQRLDHAPTSWAAIGVSLLLVFFGGLQVATEMGWDLLLPFFENAAVGFDPMAFQGRFWAPYSSQLVHANFAVHLLGNLSVIAYSGYRTERALGRDGYFVVATLSLLFGALFVALGQRGPVIGSSVLAFGLLGAQLTIGFRFGDTLPASQRRFYGFGNLLFAAVILAGTLTTPNVSHAAHAGGFIGGLLGALLWKPQFLVASRSPKVLWPVLGALALSPMLLGPVLRVLPGALWGLQDVDVAKAGASLRIPGRFLAPAGQGISVRGMPAWRSSPSSDELFFCGLLELDWERVAQGDPLVGAVLEDDWGRLIEGSPREVKPPLSRGPGWTAHALIFDGEEGEPDYMLVEHHRLQGVWLNRVGYIVTLDEEGESGPRTPIFQNMLASLEVGEPPELAAARSAHLDNPVSERKRLDMAYALYKTGDLEQADALFALVISQGGRLAGTAVLDRLELQARFPDVHTLGEVPWFEESVLDYPGDRRLARSAVSVLVAQERCAEARMVHQGLAADRPEAVDLVTTAAAVLACEERQGSD